MLLYVIGPIACMVACAISCTLGFPVTFCQRRLGRDGHPFLFHKFRSMGSGVDEHGALLPDHERLTRFGRFLRSTSLDEIPQLFDVLRGEMSLIGPRPLPVEYRDRFTHREWNRHAVRPGITGWAVVNGRNELSWEKRFEYDLYYVENYSFSFDLKILWMTILKVVSRSGITSQGQATGEPLRPDGLGHDQ